MKLIQVNPSGSGITKQSFYSKKLGEQLNPYIDKDKDLNFDPSTALGATYGVQKKGEKKSTRGGKSSRGRGRGRTVYAPPPEPGTQKILFIDILNDENLHIVVPCITFASAHPVFFHFRNCYHSFL